MLAAKSNVTSRSRKILTPVAFKRETPAKAVKQLKGPLVLKLEAKQKGTAPLGIIRGHSVRDFVEGAATKEGGWLSNVSLPMGGSISPIDEKSVSLRIPRIELFDLFLQPYCLGRLNLTSNALEVAAVTEDCVLEGSHHVKSMGLEDRYALSVVITFTWVEAKPSITIDGSISVAVDLSGLQPFCSMPDFILKAAGDAAMATVLTVMMPVFINLIQKEFVAYKTPATAMATAPS